MKHKLWFSALLLAFVGGLPKGALAQDTVLNVFHKGQLDSLNSGILKQKRFIEVFTPASYKPGSAQQYDVLYVLDGGNWNTGLVTQVQQFLESQNYVPPTIIVSVTGIDRNKELTPTHLESWKNSGGADQFLGFIKNELIPYVNKKYPSNGDNTIWGHSLSGMFVVYTLINEPTLFKSYIAVDPSLWWDNCYVPKMAAAKLPVLAGLNATSNITLFISGREGPDFHAMKIDTMEIVLKKASPPNLTWKLVGYADETHSSVRLKSIYDGLKFTYAGLGSDIEFHPMNGIVLKDQPIKIRYFDDTARLYYTLDGTVPTDRSAHVQREFFLTGPATVTYKRLSNRKNYDKSMTGHFTTEKAPAPVPKPKNIAPGGFNYAYYEGDWDKWPDLKSLQPVKTGITDKDFDPNNFPRKDKFALAIDGFLETKEDGYYLFIFDGDKNSKLYVGNKLLVEWNGNYNHRTYSYILPLAKGFYPFRIEHFQKNKDFQLAWVYLTPGIINTDVPVPIPLEAQYHRR